MKFILGRCPECEEEKEEMQSYQEEYGSFALCDKCGKEAVEWQKSNAYDFANDR